MPEATPPIPQYKPVKELNNIAWCERHGAEFALVFRFADLLDPRHTHLVVVVTSDLIRHPTLQGVGGI